MAKKKQRCAKCGACTVVCPVYRASGGKEFYSARGKKHLIEVAGESPVSPVFEDIFAKCLLCGACTKACPRGVDVLAEVKEARSGFSRFYGEHGYEKYLARKILQHPELLGVVRVFGRTFADLLEKRLPTDSGLRLRLAMFQHNGVSPEEYGLTFPGPVVDAGKKLLYFPGCSASYLYPEIVDSCRKLLGAYGYQLVIPEGLGCCGLAMEAAGDNPTALRLARRNIEALEAVDGPILVSCGSCFAQLKHYEALFAEDPAWKGRAEAVCSRLVEMMQFLDRLPDGSATEESLVGKKKIRVFYHNPCHLRNEIEIIDEPRRLLQRCGAIELLELEDGPQCCGQGGLFQLGAPELSAVIRDDLAAKVLALAPEVITTTCSGCLMQWKTAVAAADSQVQVVHLAELLSGVIGGISLV